MGASSLANLLVDAACCGHAFGFGFWCLGWSGRQLFQAVNVERNRRQVLDTLRTRNFAASVLNTGQIEDFMIFWMIEAYKWGRVDRVGCGDGVDQVGYWTRKARRGVSLASIVMRVFDVILRLDVLETE